MIRWKALIRDVVIIFVLTGLGGFIIGMAAKGRDVNMVIVGLSNIIFSIVGFAISGCLSRTSRLRHLFQVAVAVWLLSAFNMLILPYSVVQWLAGIIAIFFAMLIGGGISYIFVRSPKEEEGLQQHGQVSAEGAPSD